MSDTSALCSFAKKFLFLPYILNRVSIFPVDPVENAENDGKNKTFFTKNGADVSDTTHSQKSVLFYVIGDDTCFLSHNHFSGLFEFAEKYFTILGPTFGETETA